MDKLEQLEKDVKLAKLEASRAKSISLYALQTLDVLIPRASGFQCHKIAEFRNELDNKLDGINSEIEELNNV